jgi:hypothetical protein
MNTAARPPLVIADDDDVGVVEAAAAEVGDGQHLEHPAGVDLLDHVGAGDGLEASWTACAHGPIFSSALPGR